MRLLLVCFSIITAVNANRFGEVRRAAEAFLKAADLYTQTNHPQPTSASELGKIDESSVNVVFDSAAELKESQDLDYKISIACKDQKCSPATEQLLSMLRLCQRCMNPTPFDNKGGNIMCLEQLPAGSKVVGYSYNHKLSDSWSVELANKYSATVYEYVCPDGRPMKSEDTPSPPKAGKIVLNKFCFDETNVSPKGYSVAVEDTVTDSNTYVLKSDIQGQEWSVLASESVDSLGKFKTMIVEFHGMRHVDKHEFYLKSVHQLRKAGFELARLRGKEGAELTRLGSVSIADTLQATYVHKQEDTAMDCRAEVKVPVQETPATTSVEINIKITVE